MWCWIKKHHEELRTLTLIGAAVVGFLSPRTPPASAARREGLGRDAVMQRLSDATPKPP